MRVKYIKTSHKPQRYLAQIVQDRLVIRCHMSVLEKLLLDKITNLRIYYVNQGFSNRSHRIDTIVTVDFPLFKYICENGGMPKDFNVILNENNN